MARAYVIAEIDVHDAEAYGAYRAGTPATIKPFGGRFVVRAGRLQALEGEPPGPRVVMIEFPSLAKAKAWYDSDDYQALLPLRQAVATGRVYIVEGVAD